MKYKKTIENFCNLLAHYRATDIDCFKGISEKRIEGLEKRFNIKFPLIYREFLLKMGKSAGSYGRGEEIFIHALPNMQKYSNEILEEDNSEFYPLKNKWVFFKHATEFFFFPTDQGDDPPVFGYLSKEEYLLTCREEDKINAQRANGHEILNVFRPFLCYPNGTVFYPSFSAYLFNEIRKAMFIFREAQDKWIAREIGRKFFQIEGEEIDDIWILRNKSFVKINKNGRCITDNRILNFR